MREKLFTAAAIVVTTAVSSWSQATETSKPVSMPASVDFAADSIDIQSPLRPENVPATWVDDDFSYVGGSNRAPARGLWVRGEFLMWAIKQGPAPVLVQSEDAGGEMTTLFGGDLDYDLRLGGRFTIGAWLDSCQKTGIEGSYFFLNGQADNFNGFSSGEPGALILSRPFFNAVTGMEDRQLLSAPGIFQGDIDISSRSRLQGADLNLISNLCCGQRACVACDSCDSMCNQKSGGYRWDFITGFRYLNLEEDLFINETLTFLPTAPFPFVPDSTVALSDDFEARNNFYGAQIGLRGEWWRDRWFVNVMGKVALGTTHQQVRINGTTVFSEPGLLSEQQGGFLALPTNIGSYSRNRFTTVPEVGINIGRQMNQSVRAYVGYNFMYWSNVVRPGNQIDTAINPTQLPTPAGPGTLVGPESPTFAFHNTDFWAQGMSLGLEYYW